jgi:serine/threonine protein kinase
MEIVVSKGGAPQPQAKVTTGWGTDGFESGRKRARYGEIKKGDTLGGFRIEEMIGAGAMAVVYKATQLSLDRPVALKILPKEFAERASFVRQFDSETDLLASLNHPNIVSIIDRGREGDTYFFAMEYIEGTTLGELLAAGELDEESFIRIMEQCAEALVYAHSKDIIHRDLKPANIMFNDQGIVKIADFGVAGLIAEGRAESSGKKKVMGTRGYMSPEQEVHINRTDERSDIFSLGAVMYRSLTETIPDHLPPEPPSALNSEVDPRLDGIVLKCLKVNADQRYQAAEGLLEALRAYHRELTRAHEVCPQCKKENPPTQRTCLHCGADLSELFDVCPNCGAENRIDVDICMSCGTSLSQLRQRTSVRISRVEERARHLAVRHRYDEAIEELKQILSVKGKVFQRMREKAERLIGNYEESRDAYYRERIQEGRQLMEAGQLNEALEVLQSLPQDAADPHGVEVLILDVKSRMEEAQGKLKGLAPLLEKRDFEAAEQLLNEVGRIWTDCPGLEQAQRQLQGSRDTEQMVQYELSEVRKHLEEGRVGEARQAFEFAKSTMPDSALVRQIEAEIARKEKELLVRNAVAEGKKAFQDGRFSQAAKLWATAAEQLPEQDARRKKLLENIAVARRRSLQTEVVKLEPARVVALQPHGLVAGGSSRGLLTYLLAGIVGAVGLVGALVLWLLLAG